MEIKLNRNEFIQQSNKLHKNKKNKNIHIWKSLKKHLFGFRYFLKFIKWIDRKTNIIFFILYSISFILIGLILGIKFDIDNWKVPYFSALSVFGIGVINIDIMRYNKKKEIEKEFNSEILKTQNEFLKELKNINAFEFPFRIQIIIDNKMKREIRLKQQIFNLKINKICNNFNKKIICTNCNYNKNNDPPNYFWTTQPISNPLDISNPKYNFEPINFDKKFLKLSYIENLLGDYKNNKFIFKVCVNCFWYHRDRDLNQVYPF